jgi:hypothetical protein
MFKKAYIILASFFLLANDSYAATSQSKLDKIKGVEEIDILISLDEGFIKETGLSEKRIENLISVKFRQSGIKITKEARDTFFVNVLFTKAYCCATLVGTQLWSPSYLERNLELTLSNAWEDSTLISGNAGSRLGDSVVSCIEECLDEFLNLYLEANPREFTPK